MLYPIAIEPGDETHAYGVIVPDIPGCFSAGDTLEEAYQNVKEAIVFHLEGLVEDGEEIPMPTSIDNHRKN
ncbi:type II toxin-antitoxin system HicB family antitoxin, partial [Glaesserella parasuis]